MIGRDVVIRNARQNDWDGFRKVDEIGFNDSGIQLITKEQFSAWLNVFPEGFFITERSRAIVGYIYMQICDFDPFDSADNRNFDEITDHGFTYESHNKNGCCLYVVSVAATDCGVGKLMVSKTIELAAKYQKKYYAGACRMPGVKKFLESHNYQHTSENVELYVKLVSDSIKGNRKGLIKYFDPVLSVFLKIKKIYYFRIIENFLSDKNSCNWATVLGCEL